MKALDFDTASLPSHERLPAYRTSASDFDVAAIGRPVDFAVRWRLLALGDVNAIHSTTTPLAFRRTNAMIEADGRDRVTIHYYLSGGEVGMLDGVAAEARAGDAIVWDLARPIDMRSTGPSELVIVTLPRHLLQDVIQTEVYSVVVPATPELAVAASQTRYMIDHAGDLPSETAPFFGRAVRDLFAVAMLPILGTAGQGNAAGAPLLRRVCDLLDERLRDETEIPELAVALGVSNGEVRRALERFGDIRVLRERRRLLAAYRRLSDPIDTASISEIAWSSGFDDLSRFSRRFRDIFSISPTALRQQLGGHLPSWAGAYDVATNYGTLMVPTSFD